MSTQCRIHCFNCDKDYYVYERGIDFKQIVDCPHCDAKMDSIMWKKVVEAILTTSEANTHFVKYHSERGEDLFGISVENVHVPSDNFRD